MKFESPHYVRLSLAAAITLGFERGLFYRDAKSYCVNLLLTYEDGCKAACAFCGQSKSASKQKFIRVAWPVYKLEDIINRINTVSHLNRICVSMVTHPNAYEDLKSIVLTLKNYTHLPLSVLAAPTVMHKDAYFELKKIGVEMTGVAIDTATETIFEKLRGKGVNGPHRWHNYWTHVKKAVEAFGRGNVGIHLISGLGETEFELLSAVQRAMDLGARTHLFSFFPEKGTPLENQPQPPIESYRRVQLARYLINELNYHFSDFEYDGGTITDFNLPPEKKLKIVESGLPFLTAGCPNRAGVLSCNRPYSNETPLQAAEGLIRNYPFMPSYEDMKIIKSQLHDIIYNSLQ